MVSFSLLVDLIMLPFHTLWNLDNIGKNDIGLLLVEVPATRNPYLRALVDAWLAKLFHFLKCFLSHSSGSIYLSRY